MASETPFDKLNKYAGNLVFNEHIGQTWASASDNAQARANASKGIDIPVDREKQDAINAAAKAGDTKKLDELMGREPAETVPVRAWFKKVFGKQKEQAGKVAK